MSRVWFTQPLETAASFWRVSRRDGVTLGFTSHDRDLWFDGVLHRAAPGMAPSAIRRTAGLDEDSADVAGALSHDSVTAADLAAGRYDGARVRIGLVDWESLARETVWIGSIGAITEQETGFAAELASRKVELLQTPVPRTSPACRAAFCGPGCNLNPGFYTHDALVTAVDVEAGTATIVCDAATAQLLGGTLRWLGGAQAGSLAHIHEGLGGALLLEPPPPNDAVGQRVIVREGCDHRLQTCAERFDNAVNFRGEPFLPGNDLLIRYPTPLP